MEFTSWGPLCAFGSAATWALGSARYSRLSQDYSPFSINFARAIIALPLFILTTFVLSGGWQQGLLNYELLSPAHWGWFTLSMVSSYGIGDSLFLLSTQSLGVPGALAIASSYPIWTVLVGYCYGTESISTLRLIGLGISVLGVATVVLNTPRPVGDGSTSRRFSTFGILLAFLVSLAWATNSFAISRGGVGVISSVGNTVRMITALMMTAGLNRILNPQKSLLLPKVEMKRWFWLFAIEAFGGSTLYLYGMSHSPLAIGSMLSSLAPVISVPVSLFLGLEKFSLYRTLGVGCVAFGIWLLIGSF